MYPAYTINFVKRQINGVTHTLARNSIGFPRASDLVAVKKTSNPKNKTIDNLYSF